MKKIIHVVELPTKIKTEYDKFIYIFNCYIHED